MRKPPPAFTLFSADELVGLTFPQFIALALERGADPKELETIARAIAESKPRSILH